jgi:hypothetical protein
MHEHILVSLRTKRAAKLKSAVGEYEKLIERGAMLSAEDVDRLADLAEQLGLSEEQIAADLNRDKADGARPAYLMLTPAHAYPRPPHAETIYISQVIDRVACGPDFERSRFAFRRADDQPQQEFDELHAIVGMIGPTGAGGAPASREAVQLLIAAGVRPEIACTLSRKTAHVRAAILQSRIDAERGKGIDRVGRLHGLLGLATTPPGKIPLNRAHTLTDDQIRQGFGTLELAAVHRFDPRRANAAT